MKSSSSGRTLQFAIPHLNEPLSVDFKEAEQLHNALLMANLVGNLVVATSDGKFVPSVAESWSTEGTRWKFKLREGLRCENGELITAEGYRKSLMRAIRRLSNNGRRVPVFEELLDFEYLINGSSNIKGISAAGDLLTLDFKTQIRRGVIEYLAMPSLGYDCEANYLRGKWRDPSKIVSSGPFRIKEWSPGHKYVLERRVDWLPTGGNVKEVIITKKDSKDIEPRASATIVASWSDQDLVKDGFVVVKEVPQSLLVVTLEPHRFFKNKLARRLLQKKIEEKKKNFPLESVLASKANSFFSSQPNETSLNVKEIDFGEQPNSPLMILTYPDTKAKHRLYLEQVLTSALDDLKWPYHLDRLVERTTENLYSDKYDIRLFGAEVGGGAEDWVLDMLFCGELGPQFPDPDGRICELNKKYRSGLVSYGEFVSGFNQILDEDAAVIPMVHLGRAWLVSEDIEIDAFTPITSLPDFSEIRLKHD